MGYMNTKEFNLNPFLWILVALLMFSFSQVAEAKRFGGGGSFGYQKQVAPKQSNTAPKKNTADSAKTSSATQTKPASGASKWLGPLAGFAAGGLLAAMLFGDGFEGIQLFDILLFALIAFVLFKIFAAKVRQQNQYQTAEIDRTSVTRVQYEESSYQDVQYRQSQDSYQPSVQQGSIIGADLEGGIGQGPSQEAQFFHEIPAWFDEQQFVTGAKQHFTNLQKAWDNVELAEIQSYCTEELFAALEMQLQGVTAGDNQTRVDELNAEIAAMAVDGDYFIVSIRFSGFIEEDARGAHAFNEIWHIRRLANDEGDWKVAGIQQSDEII